MSATGHNAEQRGKAPATPKASPSLTRQQIDAMCSSFSAGRKDLPPIAEILRGYDDVDIPSGRFSLESGLGFVFSPSSVGARASPVSTAADSPASAISLCSLFGVHPMEPEEENADLRAGLHKVKTAMAMLSSMTKIVADTVASLDAQFLVHQKEHEDKVSKLVADKDRLVADNDRLVADNDRLVADNDRLRKERDALAEKLERPAFTVDTTSCTLRATPPNAEAVSSTASSPSPTKKPMRFSGADAAISSPAPPLPAFPAAARKAAGRALGGSAASLKAAVHTSPRESRKPLGTATVNTVRGAVARRTSTAAGCFHAVASAAPAKPVQQATENAHNVGRSTLRRSARIAAKPIGERGLTGRRSSSTQGKAGKAKPRWR